MVEIPKRIGKKMNADSVATQYISTGVHKRHYWLVEDKKAFKLYEKFVKEEKER